MSRARPVLGVYIILALAHGGLGEESYEAVYGHGSHKLVVATGSPGELGLLEVLAERFAKTERVTVCWKMAGSGKSLDLLHQKQVDVVMVHAPAAEQKAVREGWAVGRTLLGSNEFFLVGPASDPAGIAQASTAADAYRRIAARQARFLSRGDNSGTHKKELAIWKAAGIEPRGAWYVRTGDFMRATLQRANAEKAYFMTDSSTWFAEARGLANLKPLFRGDPLLVNVYHALGRPDAPPAAARFVAFLASKPAQQVIRDYGTSDGGQALYLDVERTKRRLQNTPAQPRATTSRP